MRAAVRDAYGSAEVVTVREVDAPAPKPDQVLVRVRAAGIDRGTWHLMTGLPMVVRPVLGLRRPRDPRLGLDVAGVVESVGPAVTRFRPGDEVFGFGAGGLAELAVAPEAKLAAKPRRWSFVQAAAVPVSGSTALQALAQVHGGQTVLILGASGGVGSYAVLIAKLRGAEVTGVCSAAKADFVRGLGADHVQDHAHPVTGRYDVILDAGGNRSLRTLRDLLTPTGTLMLVGGEGARWFGMGRLVQAPLLSPFVRPALRGMIARERHEDLTELAGLDLTPPVDRTYPLADTAAALADLEAGRVRGKLVVTT